MSTQQKELTWNNFESLSDAIQLVDMGQLINWEDARRIHKVFAVDDHTLFAQHLAKRFGEKSESRLIDEILVEVLLGWLIHAPDEKPLQIFLSSFIEQPGLPTSSLRLVEVLLSAELADSERIEELFSLAVSIVAELGLAVHAISKSDPSSESSLEFRKTSEGISTFLLSVSNANSMSVRLTLLNYFATLESGAEHKSGLNKVLARFGHTVLDQLFQLLFQKKSEAVALQYIVDNLPFALEGDRHAQTIIHETWKFYMLKNPERFGLFLKVFCESYLSIPYNQNSSKALMQQLGALMRVAADVHHRELVHSLISAFAIFGGRAERDQVLKVLIKDEDMRPQVREYVKDLLKFADPEKVIAAAARFTDSKRGRKPSFSRADGWTTVNQVKYLGKEADLFLKAS